MASTDGLVPITRAFLSRYYDKYPFTPLSDDVSRLSTDLRAMANDLRNEFPASPGEEFLVREADSHPPHKMDENMWRNREHIEEILFLLEKSHWPRLLQQQSTSEYIEIVAALGDLQVKLKNTLKTLESFQSKNADSIFNTVMTYMPQDFRGTLIRQQRERSERNRQAEIDALISSGGSIRDRYALLWNQQMERRRQLAQLGSATGVYKTLVKYLVGVPEVLLDFIRQINDDEGPMEEQRQRYGPSLYSLTSMVLSIRLFLLLYWGRFETRKPHKDQLAVLEQAVHVYTSEFERFLKFISEVFANSPFLISAEDAGALESRKNDDYKETIILPGKTYEVSLTVESANSYIAWEFSVAQGKMNMDIGFRVEYSSPSGETIMILPYRRYESNQGNFCTLMGGCYKLIWDNSYSTFFKKSLRYKVDAVHPVVDALQMAADGS
ncbi:retinal-binding protein [Tasmannia lanceolata]|uniref:retinal-binding protein n=1 Tax=Tasmannia lanceolata TaxID=3420 RepID=UPI004063ADED